MKRAVLIATLVVSGAMARAQDPGTAPAQDEGAGPIALTSPLSISAGREQQLLVGRSKVNDSAMIISAPTFSFIKSTPIKDFSLNYTPEVEIFKRYSDLNT